MRALVRTARGLLVATGALLLSAHVGSPDTFYEGAAGPYKVRVIIRAPAVIPAQAEVVVRVLGGRVQGVTAAPYVWDAGDAGAPPPDQLARVAGDTTLWSTHLWIMRGGSYAVRVHVTGAAGEGTAVVPYVAQATTILTMDPKMGIGLAAFGLFLVVGLLTLVGAASRESTLDPGVAPPPEQVRRSWVARGVAAVIIATLLVLGRVWWNAENAAYARSVWRPVPLDVATRDSAGRRWLALRLDPEQMDRRRWSPFIPDHGKMMHLFAVRTDLGAIAHLHPALVDSTRWLGALPALAPGRYQLFADIVRETGAAETMVGTLTVADSTGGAVGDPDDATWAGQPGGDQVALSDGTTLTWARGTAPIVAGVEAPLAFVLTDGDGRETSVEPFLGMAGHAMVVRDSLDVFVHLHPVGTASLAAQQALVARTAADTARGALARRLAAADSTAGAHGDMPGMVHGDALPGRFSFPYAFPKAGRYRVFVQFRRGGVIRTVPFEVSVAGR